MGTPNKNSRIVVVGAGLFGLSLAHQLASEGYKSVVVLDRHMPPVPNGSSTDISRVIRFDYADLDYLDISLEAYKKWCEPQYKDMFQPAAYILSGNTSSHGQAWIKNTTAALDSRSLPWARLGSAAEAKKLYPVLSGDLAPEPFNGYLNRQAGWADANKAITQLRDDCLSLGVSFVCGRQGTVIGLDTDPSTKTVKAVRTLDGRTLDGDHFIFTTGAWISNLVPMYNSTMATAQVLGYMRLKPEEVEKYKDLPIYYNASTGWFNFPPHPESQMLKVAVHGWGYTRSMSEEERRILQVGPGKELSSPPLATPRERTNFAPADGQQRLRDGIQEILPELADRPFERTAVCWYTDTPEGDFIMDFHPDYKNVFVGGGGSGHAFKFLPVLGEYIGKAWHQTLSPHLANKWRFRTEYAQRGDAFWGDGSRGGPVRRELDVKERAKL